jgi:hypothetical protein
MASRTKLAVLEANSSSVVRRCSLTTFLRTR